MRAWHWWWGCCGAAIALLALVGLLGDSAASPGLGPATGSPPFDVAARPPSWLVTLLLGIAYLLGAAGVWGGLRALATGDGRPRAAGGRTPGPRAVGIAALAAVAALVLVPPVGSADHLSYVAYGRIAAAGGDPYAVPPIDWRGGHDPVAGAVQPPWQHTPSVYGPVATGAMALVSRLGGGSLRPTVWCWQLLCGLAFLLVGALLDRLAGAAPERRARVAVLWTMNPLLLGQLVLGAHVDVLAAALGVGGLALVALVARRPRLTGLVPGGLLLGAAVGTKVTYALFGLAALWSLRRVPPARRAGSAAVIGVAALAVLVPAHLWAGPHVFDQLRRASRFTSLATPWRAVADLTDLVLGPGAAGALVAPLALALAGLLIRPLWRRIRLVVPPADGVPEALEPLDGIEPLDGPRAALVLTAAWALTAPYALPWYDAMVWAPLTLAAATALDGLLLTRLAILALAYVPGRVLELTPAVETLTLGMRRYVAPVLVLAVIVAVVRWARGAATS